MSSIEERVESIERKLNALAEFFLLREIEAFNANAPSNEAKAAAEQLAEATGKRLESTRVWGRSMSQSPWHYELKES